jgi:hypothetical protein
MRTFMLLFFAAFALISCEDVQTNSPALQAELNDVLYRATDVRAEIRQNGNLVIQGITDLESLTITLSGSSEGVYVLGGQGTNRAVFQDFLGSVYTTRPYGDGEVVIQSNRNNLFTGTFKFNAYRFGLDTLNAQKGFFYEVPLIAGSTQPEPDPAQNILSATIDGVEFDAQNTDVTNTNNTITINGVNGNQTIVLTFPNNITPGVNQIGQGVSAQYILDGDTFEAISGNISILIHDTNMKAISGNFSFETDGNTPFVIEEGVFSITYQ